MVESIVGQGFSYELEMLDEIIIDNLLSIRLEKHPGNELLLQWQEKALAQKEIIKRNLIRKVYSLENEKMARNYILIHQVRISYLIESLSTPSRQEGVDTPSEIQQAIRTVRQVLFDLMHYILKQFKEYVNLDETATASIVANSAIQLERKLNSLDKKIGGELPHLYSMAVEPIRELIDCRNKQEVSFRMIYYYETLLNELESLVSKGIKMEDSLKKVLVGLNFNSSRFFAYLVEEFETTLLPINSIDKKISRLNWHLKYYKQLPEQEELCLNPRQPIIRNQVINWLVEEIAFLEKELQTRVVLSLPALPTQSNSFKLHVELSVPQLGYLLKLLFESGVLKKQYQPEVIKLIAANVRTNHIESISAESLRTKFYNVDENTKEAVKEIVIKMLNEINKKK